MKPAPRRPKFRYFEAVEPSTAPAGGSLLGYMVAAPVVTVAVLSMKKFGVASIAMAKSLPERNCSGPAARADPADAAMQAALIKATRYRFRMASLLSRRTGWLSTPL